MSERLTSAWTPDLVGAFGNNPNVLMGRNGELAVLNEVASWNDFEVIDHEQDKALQLKGIDISIKKSTWSRFYTVDVKTGRSYLDQYGTIRIDLTEDGWLFNPSKTSDRVWHVNLDTGWMAWYDRIEMKAFIQHSRIKETTPHGFDIPVRDKSASFITRRKMK